jgi:pimeloyl-ACP methyl ester carboxylesterase
VDQVAKDILSVMDAMKIKQAHILGNSLGAHIAMFMAMRAPSRIQSLMLIAQHAPVEVLVRHTCSCLDTNKSSTEQGKFRTIPIPKVCFDFTPFDFLLTTSSEILVTRKQTMARTNWLQTSSTAFTGCTLGVTHPHTPSSTNGSHPQNSGPRMQN